MVPTSPALHPAQVPQDAADAQQRTLALGTAVNEVARRLMERFESIGLLYHGNVTPWGHPLMLTEAIAMAYAARTHIMLMGETGSAKTTTAAAAGTAMHGEYGLVSCVGTLDESIYKSLVPTKGGVVIEDSPFVRVPSIVLDEINRVLPPSTPVIKMTTSGGFPAHQMVYATGNPAGPQYHVQQVLDRAIASSFCWVAVDHATSMQDKKRLRSCPPLLLADLSKTAMLNEDGTTLYDTICRVRALVPQVPLSHDAAALLDAMAANRCIRSDQKPERLDSHCGECSCQQASQCGLVGRVATTTVMKLARMSQVLYAMRVAAGLEADTGVQPPHVLTVLPMLVNEHTAHLPRHGSATPVQQVLTWARGLLGAVGKFRSAFAGVLEDQAGSGGTALDPPAQAAIEAFAKSVNPSVPLALL